MALDADKVDVAELRYKAACLADVVNVLRCVRIELEMAGDEMGFSDRLFDVELEGERCVGFMRGFAEHLERKYGING